MRHWYSTVREAAALDIGPGLKMVASRFVIDEEGDRIGRVRVGRNCNLNEAKIIAKMGAVIEIGDNAIIKGQIVAEQDSKVVIGNDFVCNSPVDIRSGGRASVTFGNGCLLSNVSVYATDYHKIMDAESGQVLNQARDIEIGDRVWLAMRAIVLKGALIGHDSVVAAASMVTGKFPPHSLLMGSPATVKRSGIVWSR